MKPVNFLSYKEIQILKKEIKRLEKRLDWLDTSNYFERRDFVTDFRKLEYIKKTMEAKHGYRKD